MSIEEQDYKFCPTCKTELQWKNLDGGNYLSCPNCGFIFWNNPKPVVSMIISKDDKILMLQRANEPLKDFWVLPGGFMKYEETPEQSTAREVKEETQMNVIIQGLVGVYRIDNDPRGVHIDIIYFGKSNSEIELSEEDKKYAFFEVEKLPVHIAYKHREAIADWVRNIWSKK